MDLVRATTSPQFFAIMLVQDITALTAGIKRQANSVVARFDAITSRRVVTLFDALEEPNREIGKANHMVCHAEKHRVAQLSHISGRRGTS